MQIPLTKDRYATVDVADFEWLNQWKWCYSASGYAVRTEHLGPNPNKKGKYLQRGVYMHCLIANSPNGTDTDHKDGDRLNNKRSNLRICTHRENNSNQKLRKNNTTGYKGVHWYSARNKWQASICVNYKPIHLGYFKSVVEAASAYNKAALKYFGEFSKLNNIKEKI